MLKIDFINKNKLYKIGYIIEMRSKIYKIKVFFEDWEIKALKLN